MLLIKADFLVTSTKTAKLDFGLPYHEFKICWLEPSLPDPDTAPLNRGSLNRGSTVLSGRLLLRSLGTIDFCDVTETNPYDVTEINLAVNDRTQGERKGLGN